MTTSEATTTDGVRLLSHRPSVLYKVEHLATEPTEGDIAVEGLKLAGPDWVERLKTLLQALSQSERACLFAVRLSDEQALPLPAETLLDRARTDWFPEFLSHGLMRPHFQPIVELTTGRCVRPRGADARQARRRRGARRRAAGRRRGARRAVLLRLARPRRGARDRPAADARGRDPVRQPRPARGARRRFLPAHDLAAGRAASTPTPRGSASSSCARSAAPTARCSRSSSQAHRKRGALIALDDLSGGTDSLAYLEPLKPDFAKIDNKLTAGIQYSDGRRRLVAALVECAHECGARVVAEGIERVGEFEAMRDLGVDFGQGFYFGHPTERPMAVDPRLVRARPELV